MIELYRQLPEWMGPRLRSLFVHIADNKVPMIVHCAAGKDRTGIAIALLLAALDVPQETIVRDYLLTNDATNFEQFIVTRQASQLGLATTNHPLLTLDVDVRRVLFSAHSDFLAGAFAAIRERDGGVNDYLARHGVDDTTRRRAAESLLDKA